MVIHRIISLKNQNHTSRA